MNTSAELKILCLYFLKFIRAPIETIKTLPQSRFRCLLLFQVLLSAAFGSLTGVISSRSWHVWIWLFTFPIIIVIVSSLLSFTLLLTLKIFLRREEPFANLYRLVFVSLFPFTVFFPLLSYLPPLFLVCCALTTLLLIVGLVENFNIPQSLAIKIVGAMGVVFILVWILNQIQSQEGLSSL
ncbi:MAG: hypothetical protein SGJ18_09060 [Pseudomonadota bacterium]|nr:hypothetical protein [Pseudomonadota bacterium]